MIAVFDFDRTLTRRDTTRRLCGHLARRCGRSSWYYVAAWLGFRLHLWDERRFKTALARHFLAGCPVPEAEAAAAACLAELKDGGFRAPVLATLRRHVAAGDRVYVASANFDVLIAAFGADEGLAGWFATALDVAEGVHTGELAGPVLRGESKLAALEAAFGTTGLDELKFYGDAEDRVLLQRIPNHEQV
jgi:HAD superfamily phosphoserine phosphatase-like hydrolase